MTTSKSWSLVVTGYSVLVLAMLAFLTVNGVSAAAAGTVATATLIVLGFCLRRPERWNWQGIWIHRRAP